MVALKKLYKGFLCPEYFYGFLPREERGQNEGDIGSVPKKPSESRVDSFSNRSLGFASLKASLNRRRVQMKRPTVPLWLHRQVSSVRFMFDLTFSLLEGGLPQQGRVVVLFRFTTPSRIVRSGMLNFDRTEGRFVGPQRNPELMDAAREFIDSVEPGAAFPRSQTA